MPAPSVTYSFSNGTVADASQVNQNFTDIINGVSDGTKDLSISALTVAGNFSATGTTNTIGNASSDDFVLTASLASTINIKTTNTYNIGSSTLGLAGIYLGANSQTVRIVGSGSMSATWTLTLPVTAGTANYALTTNGSGVTSWTAWSTSAWAATSSALGTVYLPNSYVRYSTSNGHGSTNTKVRRFITENSSAGTAITYADSAANGATFTISQTGVYAVSVSDVFSAAAQTGWSVNSADLTTDIQSISAAVRLCMTTTGGNNIPGCAAASWYLDSGAVLRVHTNGQTDGANNERSQASVTLLFRTA